MKLRIHGGIGEKGRTCIGVEHCGTRLLLDVGVDTGAQGAAYYPTISRADLERIDAIIVTHAPEEAQSCDRVITLRRGRIVNEKDTAHA